MSDVLAFSSHTSNLHSLTQQIHFGGDERSKIYYMRYKHTRVLLAQPRIRTATHVCSMQLQIQAAISPPLSFSLSFSLSFFLVCKAFAIAFSLRFLFFCWCESNLFIADSTASYSLLSADQLPGDQYYLDIFICSLQAQLPAEQSTDTISYLDD